MLLPANTNVIGAPMAAHRTMTIATNIRFVLTTHPSSIPRFMASSVAMMTLDEESANITLSDGTWWDFTWLDFPMPGYFSPGDLYQIRTNSTGDIDVAIFDSWANQWTGGPLVN